MRAFTRGMYLVFGAAALIAGVGALLKPSLILTPDVYSPLTAHLIREEAAAFVFIGLMFLWCWRHYDQRRPVHFAFLVFTAMFAGIHWAGYLDDFRHIQSPLVNSVPFVLLAITAPVDRSNAA